MRITVTIQDRLMEELMKITDAKTKTMAVNQAVSEWLRTRKIQKIKTLRGKLSVDNTVDDLRKLELKEVDELNG